MFKGLGILVSGIFIGAVGAEVIRKACPGSLDKLYAKAAGLTNVAKDAFLEGYHGVLGTQEPAPAGT